MDIFYDLVEGIHVFIPIVAVVFLVAMIFLFGTSRGAEPEPTLDYIDKLHQHAPATAVTTLPKAKKPPPTKQNSATSSPTSAEKRVTPDNKKEAKPPKSDEKPAVKSPKTAAVEEGGVRQRKAKKAGDSPTKAASEPADDDWVTVTPKKKAKTGVLGGGVSVPQHKMDKTAAAARKSPSFDSYDESETIMVIKKDETPSPKKAPAKSASPAKTVAEPAATTSVDHQLITDTHHTDKMTEMHDHERGNAAVITTAVHVDEHNDGEVEGTADAADKKTKRKKKKDDVDKLAATAGHDDSAVKPTSDDDGWQSPGGAKGNRRQKARRE